MRPEPPLTTRLPPLNEIGVIPPTPACKAQPRGLTVKARNCSAAFRAAPRPDRQEPGQS
jgi:hypothetical protein